MRKLFSFIATASLVTFSACKKTTEKFPTAPLSDYFPLAVGKYITYSLDSIVYYDNFGTSASTKSYQVKQVVDAQITDNLGRPGYRIIRYIRSTPTAAWVADNTFMAINTGTTLEWVENNLRFMKLKEPIQQDYTWKGNSYINTNSQTPYLKYYDDWDYYYDSLNMPAKIGTLTVDSTIKVSEIDDQTAIDRTFSEAKYAKGIGLVYRNFLYWNKGNANGTYSDNSYGVILKMIDHN
ncbi:hypothetical protein [Ferruginibacter sp. SUN106]|uniref:hypothetical protein n=1 Tax=Ferruginibacter sp. SUN106 TaxID=2978348 RepID=UPI003D360A12